MLEGSLVRSTSLALGCAAALLAGCGSSSSPAGPAPVDAGADAPDVGDPSDFKTPPKSCSLTCPVEGCAENTTPYACPGLAGWSTLPHADACEAWDGTYPAPVATKCTVSAPGGDAVKYAGADPDDPSVTVLPDGRRVKAAGSRIFTNDASLSGGQPVAVLAVPQTSWLVLVDAGYGVHAVQIVDRTKIAGGGAVVSTVKYPAPKTLSAGVVFVPPDLVLVASEDGVVEALTLDTATGALTADATRSIAMPKSIDDTGAAADWYGSGLALSPDATKLVVTSVFDHHLLVVDVTKAGYGTILGTADLGNAPTQQARVRPERPHRALRLRHRARGPEAPRGGRVEPRGARRGALVGDRQEPLRHRLPRRAVGRRVERLR